MSKLLQAGMTACAAILLAAMLTTPAAARIQCHGNFQVTKYGLIATPYCEEEQIAFVARSYGQRVAAAILRRLRTGLLRPRSLTVARTQEEASAELPA